MRLLIPSRRFRRQRVFLGSSISVDDVDTLDYDEGVYK
jgi:hypothetical protein